MKMIKGQINLWIALVGAVGMLGASAIGGWFSASNRVGNAETKIEVVAERENNHYLEVQKQLTSIEKKLDTIISNNKSAK